MVSELAIKLDQNHITSEELDIKPILKKLAEQFCLSGENPFEDVLLVGMQHVLSTTVDMLQVMYDMGLRDAVIGGKSYSTHFASIAEIEALGYDYIYDGGQIGYGRFDESMRERVHNIWHRALELINQKVYKLVIILDDGADLLRATPGIFFRARELDNDHIRPGMLIGIEQTRGGSNHALFHGFPFPIINVAGSFIKTKAEYQWVSSKVCSQVETIIHDEIEPAIGRKPIIGVVGYGTMGQKITKEWTEKDYQVIVFEKNVNRREYAGAASHYHNSAVLISNADIIIGCTGTDITEDEGNLNALLYSQDKKWLVSTSSKDSEFNTLLRNIQNEVKRMRYMPDPLGDVHYDNHVGEAITIIRGGFPINFDNDKHSIMPDKIWPTRAALLLACITAAESTTSLRSKADIYMLPRQAQLLVLREYLKCRPNDRVLGSLVHLNSQELLDLIGECSAGSLLDVYNGQLEMLHS